MATRLALLLIAICTLGVLGEADARPRKRQGTGTFELHSLTEGATVQVDGAEVGVTPLPEPLTLTAGKHTLKITKLGYTEFVDVINIQPGQLTKLDVDLLPFAGVLVVTANVEGARVFIDGKFEGLTPLEKEALIGRRSVRVSKAGYYDFIASVKATAGKTRRVRANLKPLPIGSTPYRPKPLPPPKWYERWYVWAGAAGGLVAVTLAVVLPVTLIDSDKVSGWGEKYAMVPKPR